MTRQPLDTSVGMIVELVAKSIKEMRTSSWPPLCVARLSYIYERLRPRYVKRGGIDVIMDEHDRGEAKRLYFLIARDISYKVEKIGGVVRNDVTTLLSNTWT